MRVVGRLLGRVLGACRCVTQPLYPIGQHVPHFAPMTFSSFFASLLAVLGLGKIGGWGEIGDAMW